MFSSKEISYSAQEKAAFLKAAGKWKNAPGITAWTALLMATIDPIILTKLNQDLLLKIAAYLFQAAKPSFIEPVAWVRMSLLFNSYSITVIGEKETAWLQRQSKQFPRITSENWIATEKYQLQQYIDAIGAGKSDQILFDEVYAMGSNIGLGAYGPLTKIKKRAETESKKKLIEIMMYAITKELHFPISHQKTIHDLKDRISLATTLHRCSSILRYAVDQAFDTIQKPENEIHLTLALKFDVTLSAVNSLLTELRRTYDLCNSYYHDQGAEAASEYNSYYNKTSQCLSLIEKNAAYYEKIDAPENSEFKESYANILWYAKRALTNCKPPHSFTSARYKESKCSIC